MLSEWNQKSSFLSNKKTKKKNYNKKMPASALKVTIKLFKAENQFTSQLGQQTKASVSVFLDPIAFVWLTKPGRENITWNRYRVQMMPGSKLKHLGNCKELHRNQNKLHFLNIFFFGFNQMRGFYHWNHLMVK